MNLIFCIIVLILTNSTIATAPPINVVFIIQSQDTTYQNELSRNLKEDIIKQSFELQPKYRIKVHVLHEIFNYPGGWTIHNLIPQLMLLYQRKSHMADINTNTNMNTNTNTNQQIDMKIGMKIETETGERKREDIITNNTRWIVFCEDTTKVKVKLLMERLNNENHTQPLYLGHPLYDREPTIIHHFAFFENPKWFPYPMLQAGVVFSWPLFKSIADIYHNHNSHNNNNNKRFKQSTTLLQHSEFSIDAAHELARFIYDNIEIPTITPTTSTISLNNNNNYNKMNHNDNINAQREKSATFTTTDQPARSATLTSAQQRDTFNALDAKDSVLTHSDYHHSTTTTTSTNEIIDKHKTEDIAGTPGSLDASIHHGAALTNTVVTKRQKIILRKASYICAKATREAHSIDNKKNNHITSSGSNNVDTTCAMYAEQTTATAASASSPSSSSVTCVPVKRENIYFAVKTCAKYHSERLPIIQATWASYAKHVKYFSDLQDDTIPTINIGMPNVEVGHCDKTLRILKLALKDIENYNSKYNNNDNNNNKAKYLHQQLHEQQQQQHLPYDINQAKHENHQIKWLLLTDDDTLLSVSGVCQVLGCYDSMDEIYLGERYGYRLYAQDGFNYITGGGGIAFSLPVVKLILQHCSCPSPSAPDDMILGSCLHSLQLKAIHSPRFHQARPNDYAMALLKQDPPISFHKFWQLDPFEVYKTWFEFSDRQLLAEEQQLRDNMLAVGYRSKSRKLLAKPEPLNLNEIPVGLVASLHHTKERHVDL